jgi:hypothetical protein
MGIAIGNRIGRRVGGSGPDGVPSGLTLTVKSDTEIQLDWTVGSTNHDGHSIERSPNNSTWVEITTVLGVTVTYLNTGLTSGVLYYYRVRAYKGTTYSSYSSVVSATTWIIENLGNYTNNNDALISSVHYYTGLTTLNRKLEGNGILKCYTTGLNITQANSCCIFLHGSTEFPAAGYHQLLENYIYWTSDDNKCHARSYRNEILDEVLSSEDYISGGAYRLRRTDNIVYFEYSFNDSDWTTIKYVTCEGILYAGIFFGTSPTQIKDVTIFNGTEAWPEINLGDFSHGAGVNGTSSLLGYLYGDGYIKCISTGLTEAQVDRVCMFLHNSSTWPANNATLKAYNFWYSVDHKAHAEKYNVAKSASAGTFAAGNSLRIIRAGQNLTWQYSSDDTNWSNLQSWDIDNTIDQRLYAGLMYILANTQIKQVKLKGLVSFYYNLISSGDMRFYVPIGYTSGKKVILYVHGSGEDEDAPMTDVLKVPTIRVFLSQGWGIISCYAQGNNWGNPASLADYYTLIAWAATQYTWSEIDIFAQSMGGLNGLQLFMHDSQFDKFLGIYPVTNLADMYAGAFKTDIKTAYGIVNDSEYAAKTVGCDPMLLSSSLLAGRKMELVASAGDTTVSKTNNTDAFNTSFGAFASIRVITATGDHGDTSHFNPMRDSLLFNK